MGFEPVLPYDNRALAATARSTRAAGQEFTKARDGVVSGYPRIRQRGTSAWAKGGADPVHLASAQPLVSVPAHLIP